MENDLLAECEEREWVYYVSDMDTLVVLPIKPSASQVNKELTIEFQDSDFIKNVYYVGEF